MRSSVIKAGAGGQGGGTTSPRQQTLHQIVLSLHQGLLSLEKLPRTNQGGLAIRSTFNNKNRHNSRAIKLRAVYRSSIQRIPFPFALAYKHGCLVYPLRRQTNLFSFFFVTGATVGGSLGRVTINIYSYLFAVCFF